MTAYYVLGISFVVFALVLSAFGLTREGFPPSVTAGRVWMAAGALTAVVTFTVLLASTHVEHPREEAKEKAAEKKEAEEAAKPGAAGEEPPPGKDAGPVNVIETEYGIELPEGQRLKPGKVTFDVANDGKIQHDLAVEGAKEAKTPLIDAGAQAKLSVDLKPGKYKLYCTVPGHEQLGMKSEVTVGGA